MSPSRDPHPERSPHKKAPKRFFKDLVMPAVGHTKGDVPEEFQPKSETRNARFAVICCAMAVLVLGSWIGLMQIRKAMRNWAMRNTACCGCGKLLSSTSCGKDGACPTQVNGSAGCRSVKAPPQGSPGAAISNPGSPMETHRP